MNSSILLIEISRQLEEAGLEYRRRPFLDSEAIQILHGKLDGLIPAYEDSAWIWPLQDQWLFHYARSIPGPGPDDFEWGFSTPEEIIPFTQQFFLGQPVSLEEWLIPLHRHPEWNMERVRHSIAHALPLSEEAWHQTFSQALADRHRLFRESDHCQTRRPREVKWEEWFACLFVAIEHDNPLHEETLYLRRDLEQAFLVKDKHCPSCPTSNLLRIGWNSYWQPTYFCSSCQQERRRSFEQFC